MLTELVYYPTLFLMGTAILLLNTRRFSEGISRVTADTSDTDKQTFTDQSAALELHQFQSKTSQANSNASTLMRETADPAPILTDTDDPVIITDYTDAESLIIEVPDTLIDDTASAELSANERDTEIKVGGQTIAILQGYTNIDALDAQFVLTPSAENADLKAEPVDDTTAPVVVEADDTNGSVVTVTDFNLSEDQLEIEADTTLTFRATNAGADTTVLIDGVAVFLLQGITPSQMKNATITEAA